MKKEIQKQFNALKKHLNIVYDVNLLIVEKECLEYEEAGFVARVIMQDETNNAVLEVYLPNVLKEYQKQTNFTLNKFIYGILIHEFSHLYFAAFWALIDAPEKTIKSFDEKIALFSEKVSNDINNTYYVYVLRDENNNIFYIGKGVGNRLQQHTIKETEKKKHPKLYNKLVKLKKENKTYSAEIVLSGLSEEDAYKLEELLTTYI